MTTASNYAGKKSRKRKESHFACDSSCPAVREVISDGWWEEVLVGKWLKMCFKELSFLFFFVFASYGMLLMLTGKATNCFQLIQ